MWCFLFYPIFICVTLGLSAQASVRTDLTGMGFRVLFPGDAGYNAARTSFNRRYDFRPAVITFPVTVSHVATIVKSGYRNNVHVAARSGGHSYIADGLGGRNGSIVVDMGNFNTVTVNSDTTATIGSGSKIGDIVLALNSRGRALPHGTCPYVGMGGHTGYGGWGLTSRMWGLTIDNIFSIEVVLANGTVVSASRSVRPNLFWALRGAAPSFGITTYTQVKTYPAPPTTTTFNYRWTLTAAQVARAIFNYQTFSLSNIPPRLGAEMTLSQSEGGQLSVQFSGVLYGSSGQIQSILSPFLRTLPTPTLAEVKPGTYIDSAKFLAGGVATLNTTVRPDTTDTFYTRSIMVPESAPITIETLQALTGYLGSVGSAIGSSWFVQIQLWGGSNSAINSVASDATAFPHRSKLFTIQVYASTLNSRPPYPEFGVNFVDDILSILRENNLAQWGLQPAAYINYMEDGGPDRATLTGELRERYYGIAYTRLSNLKPAYDPRGVFSFPVGVENYNGRPNEIGIEIRANGGCMGVRANQVSSGNNVELQHCNGSSGQRWVINRGNTKIRLEHTNYCVYAANKVYATMSIEKCTDNLPGQSWVYSTDNTLRLSGYQSCMDGGSEIGYLIQIRGCNVQHSGLLWMI